MPVTRISALPACSAKVGASRWIEAVCVAGNRAGFVDRLADHIHDAAQSGGANRHPDRAAGVDHFLAAHQAFGGVHGDGAHRVLAQMLRHFEHQAELLAGAGIDIGGLQRVQDRGQGAVELDVDDRADDLDKTTFGLAHGLSLSLKRLRRRR